MQDTETYRGDISSIGGGISVSMSSGSKKDWLDDSLRKYDPTPYVPGTTSGSAFLGKGSMDSDYASVTQQAGIYAGEGGFTVHVEDNTRLTGSLLDSTASEDKNSLTTGTLTMEDMGNKAEYDVKNIGVSYHHYGSEAARQDNFNQSGLTPSISPGVQDEASSVTQSAIAPGTIITTKEQTDLSQINRNTADALHKLDQIFDKKDIQERQELAQLFSKNANELLHQYDRDGTFDKALAHGIVAEISSQIAGNGAGSGFAAGFTNELLINKINEWSNGDPAKAQWISAALGVTLNNAIKKQEYTGAFITQSGTKWNYLKDGHTAPVGQVGIQIFDEGVGHTALVIQHNGEYGDYGFERGEYGRYENVDSLISGYGTAPIGTGTFITDNWYEPSGSRGTTFMLNPDVINANEATYHFNWQIQSGGYQRYDASEVNDGKDRYYTYWYQSSKDNDYNLVTHNCTTTTIDAIMFGWEHRYSWNQAANDTLWLLKYEFNPSTVATILYNDYKANGGRGLVSYIINSKK